MLLCGPALDTSTCHYRFDHHQLDLYPHLTEAELRAAVLAQGQVRNPAGAALRAISAPLWRETTSEALRLLDERLEALTVLADTT